MTPRKELFLAVKNKLETISGLEMVELQRNQYTPGNENYPQFFTVCLIKIASIQWETMTGQVQEGKANIEVILYTRDGFADHQNGTTGNNDGLAEMDLIDEVAENLQFLKGECFKPLQQSTDEPKEVDVAGIMAYKLSFSTTVYKKTAAKYQTKNILHVD